MEATLDCLACFKRQGEEVARLAIADEAGRRAALARYNRALDDSDLGRQPVQIGQFAHRLIRELAADPDPYRAAKRRFNRTVLDVLPQLRAMVAASDDQLMAAARFAMAANVIDMAAATTLSSAAIVEALTSAANQPMHADWSAFRSAVDGAGSVLYLTDNTGEIVADQLLIDAIGRHRVTVGVRGNPVINDATMQDAEETGLTRMVKVISNGSDAPGTVLADCDQEFRSVFEAADLVIAKGQGNFESLHDCGRTVFCLFKVKCKVVAASAGQPVGTHVLCRCAP